MTNLVSDKFKELIEKDEPSTEIKVIVPQRRLTAVERTMMAINERWQGDNARINQAHRFIKKAIKSDKKRKMEKASRKRNRK